MEKQQEAMSTMMMMFERMLQEQREMSEITKVVQRLVQQNGEFDGKEVSRYLRDYKAEMLRYGISERLQVLKPLIVDVAYPLLPQVDIRLGFLSLREQSGVGAIVGAVEDC